MSKNIIEFIGIKKAISEFNTYQGCARIMADLSDGEVWTDVFGSSNDWNEYHSDSIFYISGKDDLLGRDVKTSMNTLKERLDTLIYLHEKVQSGKMEIWEMKDAFMDLCD